MPDLSYVMTNHIHLLTTPQSARSLPKTLQSIGRRYVPYVNGTNGRTGTLWEGRDKATLIESEGYLLTCMRYIERNPVRAGMVNHAGEYPWSSYQVNARGASQGLLTLPMICIVAWVIWQLSARPPTGRYSKYP